jgi:hypothetical protein
MVAVFERFVRDRRLVQVESEPSVKVKKGALAQKRTDVKPEIICQVEVRAGYLILFELEDGAEGTGDPLGLGLGRNGDLSGG